MIKFRENLLDKITKAEEFQKVNKSDEIAIYLTKSQLRLLKIAVRTLDSYEKIIEEECSK